MDICRCDCIVHVLFYGFVQCARRRGLFVYFVSVSQVYSNRLQTIACWYVSPVDVLRHLNFVAILVHR